MAHVAGVGLHLRLVGSLHDLALRARELGLPFFQFFVVHKQDGRLISPTQQDLQAFLGLRHHFNAVYVHGSYWINLSGLHTIGHYALRRELRMAQALEATHMVLHAGSAKGAAHRGEGIDARPGH